MGKTDTEANGQTYNEDFVLVKKRAMYCMLCVCVCVCERERERERERNSPYIFVATLHCLQPTESACLADVFSICQMEYNEASHSNRILWNSQKKFCSSLGMVTWLNLLLKTGSCDTDITQDSCKQMPFVTRNIHSVRDMVHPVLRTWDD
jgi:hypothetical protein